MYIISVLRLFYLSFLLIDRMFRIQNITNSDDIIMTDSSDHSWKQKYTNTHVVLCVLHTPGKFRTTDGRHLDSFGKNHIFMSWTVSFILTSYFPQFFVMLKRYVLFDVLQCPGNKREHLNILHLLKKGNSRMVYKKSICRFYTVY